MDRIPILKIGEILLVTIQVDFHDRIALALIEDLSTRIIESGAKGVLIDISALEMVDSFMGRVLGDIARTSRLLDAHTVLVGMQPAIAITITELGFSLKGIKTALNADIGIAQLKETISKQHTRGTNGHFVQRN